MANESSRATQARQRVTGATSSRGLADRAPTGVGHRSRRGRSGGFAVGLVASIVLVTLTAPSSSAAQGHAPATDHPVRERVEPEAPPARTARDGWNDERVLSLVDRARDARRATAVDTAMTSYRAQARGYLYFFMDRTDSDTRSLVKADQIALEVLWKAPDLTTQRIVGLRDKKLLPTDIRYHIDHMMIVQDDFGDLIEMGEGDEVSNVPHPAAAGSGEVYDFLLADSLTLHLPQQERDIRVFEVRVRPRDTDRPAILGSLFLDQATGAIVRMNFSFTPVSYVDPYVDYIRVSLDNALWLGRHWLPRRQEIEIRRELPLLDVMAGSVIRGRFEVRDYAFNVDFGPLTFVGRPVTSVSPAERAAFPFEEGLMDQVEEEGLSTPPALEEVEEQVKAVVEDRYLTGLDPFRVHLASISDVFRYNRSEGAYLGGGAAVRPAERVRIRGSLGYRFGRDEPSASLSVSKAGAEPWIPDVELTWNGARDMAAGHAGATPLENTIAALSGEEDYLDLYFVRGAALHFGARGEGPSPELTLRIEEHREARNEVSDNLEDTDFRPVRGIDAGTLFGASVTLPVISSPRRSAHLSAGGGRIADRSFVQVEGTARWAFDLPRLDGHGELSASGGWASDDAPAQTLYLLGGRHTLPGHGFRDFVGDRYWLARVETTVPVHEPWVGVRLIGAVGATYLDGRTLPALWTSTDSDGVRGSVGAGLSLGWDIMRIDLARGIDGGGWEAVFSVSPNLRPWI